MPFSAAKRGSGSRLTAPSGYFSAQARKGQDKDSTKRKPVPLFCNLHIEQGQLAKWAGLIDELISFDCYSCA